MESDGPETSHPDGEVTHLGGSSRCAPRYGSCAGSLSSVELTPLQKPAISLTRSYAAVAVLCYVNLLNYMDRYTIAGVLLNIQKFFDIYDSTSGLLQTVFICSFLLLAPIFGYLGDRYNRKYIMIGGLSVWLVSALGSSFVTKPYFWVLVLLRAIVGTGEASYTTIAPTIIGDLFSGTKRTLMIAAFYIFIPVGSGLGYIAGSSIATLTGDWRWALTLNPILGVVGLLLLIFLCPNPPRGAAETMHGQGVMGHSSYMEDVKYLLKNKSFVWSSMGVTAMAFLTGALGFWTPTFLSRAQVSQGIQPPCTEEPCDTSDSYIFGAVTVVTGILGVCLGMTLSRWLRDKLPNADPLICAVGMLTSSPCLLIAMFLPSTSIPATYMFGSGDWFRIGLFFMAPSSYMASYDLTRPFGLYAGTRLCLLLCNEMLCIILVFIAVGETLLSLNWPILADILLYVVVPNRRATAEALQITVCHLLGDAGSPYLIGAISDTLRKYNADTHIWSFHSLQYSLLLCPFIGVLGGLFFLMTTLHITKDRREAQLLVEGAPPSQPVSES